jgi:glutamate 5-kinase
MLMHTYAKLFAKHGIIVAQLLVNPDDFSDRSKYNALTRVTETLIRNKIIPIINENDAVSTAEMQDVKKKSMSSVSFGDNDVLSALVCSKMGAELLILLTDVDGLYTSNPKKDPGARLIRKVDEAELATVDAGGKGALGRGGMVTKLRAAAIATAGGSYVVIANGKKAGALAGSLVCEAGTMFEPKKGMSSRDKWIAFAAVPRGRIFLDDRACDVLIHRGASLLPVGVTHLEGTFAKGDVVELVCGSKVVGRGVTNMSSEELDKTKGMKCEEAKGKTGIACKMVINRANLVMDAEAKKKAKPEKTGAEV